MLSLLPWFVLEKITSHLKGRDLLALRVVNKDLRQQLTPSAFHLVSIRLCEDPDENEKKLELLIRIGSHCKFLIFRIDEKFCNPVPLIFFRDTLYSLPLVRCLRLYVADFHHGHFCLKDISILKSLGHLSLIFNTRISSSKHTSLPENIVSLCLYNKNSFGADPVYFFESPTLKSLILFSHEFPRNVLKAVSRCFPNITNLHIFTVHEGTIFTLLEIQENHILALGVVGLNETMVVKLNPTHPLSVRDRNLSLFAQYSDLGVWVQHGLFTGFGEHVLESFTIDTRDNWAPNPNILYSLANVGSIKLLIKNLRCLDLPRKSFSTTSLMIQFVKRAPPNFMQWIVDHFPNLESLDVDLAIYKSHWDGVFPNVTRISFWTCPTSKIHRLIKRCPRLKEMYIPEYWGESEEFKHLYPRIKFRPYPRIYRQYYNSDIKCRSVDMFDKGFN